MTSEILIHEAEFFVENAQNLIQIPKMPEEIELIFVVFQIIGFELVVVNYPFYYENTCSFQSTC